MLTEEPQGYLKPWELVCWAQASLNIVKLKEDLTVAEIKQIMRWIGLYSVDTLYIGEGTPILGRIDIGLMLTVTLIEFPDTIRSAVCHSSTE